MRYLDQSSNSIRQFIQDDTINDDEMPSLLNENLLFERVRKLEDELGKTKVENSELVFELKVAKTKIAVLEEKLANMEVGALEKGG
jgi:hypothetical protein